MSRSRNRSSAATIRRVLLTFAPAVTSLLKLRVLVLEPCSREKSAPRRLVDIGHRAPVRLEEHSARQVPPIPTMPSRSPAAPGGAWVDVAQRIPKMATEGADCSAGESTTDPRPHLHHLRENASGRRATPVGAALATGVGLLVAQYRMRRQGPRVGVSIGPGHITVEGEP